MIHYYSHDTLVVLVLFTVLFYHFSFSRYLELAERHFSSDILDPFPDSGVLYSRGLWPATLLKKRLLQVFEFCETFKGTFLNRTPHAQCLFLVPEFPFTCIVYSVILY